MNIHMKLEHRTAVVTGAASGIGRALAGALARRRCHLALADIDGFDTSCFSGEYVTGDVSRSYLDALEVVRSNSAKARRDAKVRAEESEDDTMQVASGL